MDKVISNDRKEFFLSELSKYHNEFFLSRYDIGEIPNEMVSHFSKLPIKWRHTNSSGPLETLYRHLDGFYIYVKHGITFCDVSIFYDYNVHNQVEFIINRITKIKK